MKFFLSDVTFTYPTTFTDTPIVSRVGQAVDAELLLDGDSGKLKRIGWRTGGSLRWSMHSSNNPESGGDVGSSHVLTAFDDSGVALGTAWIIPRLTQIVGFTQTPTFPTAPAGDDSTKGANTAWVNDTILDAGSLEVGRATLGVAGTTLTVSGLDLSAHESYLVEVTLKNNTAGNATLSLYFNGDTTAANYGRQLVTGINTSITGGQANNAIFGTLIASKTINGDFVVANDSDGKARAWGQLNGDTTLTPHAAIFSVAYNTVANVTSISVVAAANMAVGSTMRVLKRSAGGQVTPWVSVKKLVDTSRASNAVMSNDPELIVNLAANSTYRIKAQLFFSQATAIPDFQYQAAYSGTFASTYFRRAYSPPGMATGTDNETTRTGDTTLVATGIVSTLAGTGWAEFDMIINTTTAGAFSLQWAQNTSDATATILLKGSMLEVMKF